MKQRVTSVRGAKGLPRPLYVLPTGGGLGYGLFVLDEASRDYLLAHVEEIPDALTRGSRVGHAVGQPAGSRASGPATFLDAAMRALPREPDEQNAQRVLAYVVARLLAIPSAGRARSRVRRRSRRCCARASSAGRTQSQKAAWFNAYRDVVLTRRWRGMARAGVAARRAVPGLTLAEPDEITMALELAVREVPGWEETLRHAAGAHAESGPEGAPGVRDARAVGRPVCTRAGVRAFSIRGEPAARAVGPRIAAVPQSPAA